MKELDIPFIENTIGYTFKDKNLLVQAFTHTSFSNEHNTPSYERLEFLGDATIGYIIAHELFRKYPEIDEGKLSKSRAALVSWEAMSKIIDDMNIIEYLQVGNGDIQQNILHSDYIKCDLFEAIAGAILVDNNFKIADCKNYVLRYFENSIKEAENQKKFSDYKSLLLEKCAKNNNKAEFVCLDEKTEDNKFQVNLFINGKQVSSGNGNTKKEAEKMAAKEYLKNHS